MSVMMETKDIILIVAVFAVVGLRIYQKYFRKKDEVSRSGTSKSSIPDSPDDDYEPYSKR